MESYVTYLNKNYMGKIENKSHIIIVNNVGPILYTWLVSVTYLTSTCISS